MPTKDILCTNPGCICQCRKCRKTRESKEVRPRLNAVLYDKETSVDEERNLVDIYGKERAIFLNKKTENHPRGMPPSPFPKRESQKDLQGSRNFGQKAPRPARFQRKPYANLHFQERGDPFLSDKIKSDLMIFVGAHARKPSPSARVDRRSRSKDVSNRAGSIYMYSAHRRKAKARVDDRPSPKPTSATQTLPLKSAPEAATNQESYVILSAQNLPQRGSATEEERYRRQSKERAKANLKVLPRPHIVQTELSSSSDLDSDLEIPSAIRILGAKYEKLEALKAHASLHPSLDAKLANLTDSDLYRSDLTFEGI